MDVIDQSMLQSQTRSVKYGSFWERVGASLVDSLIFSPLTVGVMIYNISAWKSPLVLVIISLIPIIYKPLMEFNYGATWGKMALNLKVLNTENLMPTLEQVLLRNIFYIVPSLISLFLTINIYNEPDFEDIGGFTEYSAYSREFMGLQIISFLSGLLTIIDTIVMASDKHNRSLHDKIGGTVVVKTN